MLWTTMLSAMLFGKRKKVGTGRIQKCTKTQNRYTDRDRRMLVPSNKGNLRAENENEMQTHNKIVKPKRLEL